MKTFGALLMCGFILISVTSAASGQTDSAGSVNSEKVTHEAAVKLQQKILLSDKQTTEIENILNDFVKDPSNKNLDASQKKIESLLDHKQKIKFNIVKKDWWESINQIVSHPKEE